MATLLFSSVIDSQFTFGSFLLCLAVSLLLGALIAVVQMIRSNMSKSMILALALLPSIVQLVIMLVNGNVGVGVAVAGAFSLVRFRSAPGTAKDIADIFLAMAVGLATGTGYVGIAAVFTVIMLAVELLYKFIHFGESKTVRKELKIVVPETLNYTDIFEDVFAQFTKTHELIRVKTSSMGSLFTLTYIIVLKDDKSEKDFIDELRIRNGNLDIICARYMNEQTDML